MLSNQVSDLPTCASFQVPDALSTVFYYLTSWQQICYVVLTGMHSSESASCSISLDDCSLYGILVHCNYALMSVRLASYHLQHLLNAALLGLY